MHVVVLGAGAVGGYFGGRLAEHGVKVTFLVREQRAKVLVKRGLRIHSVHGDVELEPVLSTNAGAIESPDVVMVACKNYHLLNALPELEVLVQNGAVLLPLLNGIEHIHLLSRMFPQSVLGGTCFIESTLDEYGDIHHTSKIHDLVFGCLDESQHRVVEELERTLLDGGFPVKRSETVLVDMWQKYIFLSAFSAVTCITRLPIGKTLNDPEAKKLILQLLEEASEVAEREGIPLGSQMPRTIMNRLESLEPTMTSSMHRDLEKGLPLELKDIQGGLLRLARRHSVSVPAFETIYRALHPYQSGTSSI